MLRNICINCGKVMTCPYQGENIKDCAKFVQTEVMEVKNVDNENWYKIR